MLVLLILLASLLSILIITLFNIELVNQQVILFEIILISIIVIKLLISGIINKNINNKTNQLRNLANNNIPHDNLVVMRNSNNNSNILPLNFSPNLNSPTPNQVLMNNMNNQVNNQVNNQNNHHSNNQVNNQVNNLNNQNNNHSNNQNNHHSNNQVNNLNNVDNENSCLLENCACKAVKDVVGCNSYASNNNNNAGCGACAVADSLNGKNVPANCLKNNTVNYSDMLNVDTEMNQKQHNDCAFNNSCVINSDSRNLHFNSPFSREMNNQPLLVENPALDSTVFLPSPEEAHVDVPETAGPHPGDPDFTDVKDFWKVQKNNSDLCYIKRALPKFFCKQ